MKEKFVICSCGNIEHQMMLGYDPSDTDFQEMWTEVHLTQTRNFFQRVVAAVKYISGHRSRYGDWDCILIDKQKAVEIRDFINEFLETFALT